FLSTVERIDQKEAMPYFWNLSSSNGFLRKYRYIRREVSETFEDESFGFLIGRGHRGLVIFAPGDDFVGIVAKDNGSRIVGDVGQCAQHRGRRVGMNVVSHDATRSPTKPAFASEENM